MVLGEGSAAEGGRALGHVAVLGAGTGDDRHPLDRGSALQVGREPGGQLLEVGLEEADGGLAAPDLHQAVEQLGEGLLVALGEERFAGGGQAVDKAGRANAGAVLPGVADEAGGFQFLEVVADSRERQTHPPSQVLGRELAGTLELEQHVYPRTLEARRELLGGVGGGLLHRREILSERVGIGKFVGGFWREFVSPYGLDIYFDDTKGAQTAKATTETRSSFPGDVARRHSHKATAGNLRVLRGSVVNSIFYCAARLSCLIRE